MSYAHHWMERLRQSTRPKDVVNDAKRTDALYRRLEQMGMRRWYINGEMNWVTNEITHAILEHPELVQ